MVCLIFSASKVLVTKGVAIGPAQRRQREKVRTKEERGWIQGEKRER